MKKTDEFITNKRIKRLLKIENLKNYTFKLNCISL